MRVKHHLHGALTALVVFQVLAVVIDHFKVPSTNSETQPICIRARKDDIGEPPENVSLNFFLSF